MKASNIRPYLQIIGLKIAEWHAIVIGAGIAYLGGAGEAVAIITLVTGGQIFIKKNNSSRMNKLEKKLGKHLLDVKQNLGYFVGSYVVLDILMRVMTLL